MPRLVIRVVRGVIKGESRKVGPARQWRAQTTLPLAWIAERLSLGTRGHLARLLQRRSERRRLPPTDQRMLGI